MAYSLLIGTAFVLTTQLGGLAPDGGKEGGPGPIVEPLPSEVGGGPAGTNIGCVSFTNPFQCNLRSYCRWDDYNDRCESFGRAPGY